MKPSDSTNSLTALTEVVSDVECFICLELQNELQEPLVDSSLLRTCGCKFVVHPECWNGWMKDKSDWDCPICRKKSMNTMHVVPNPVISFIRQNQTPESHGFPESHEYITVGNKGLYYFFAVIILFSVIMIVSIYLSQPKH